jgi:hypothetical protein
MAGVECRALNNGYKKKSLALSPDTAYDIPGGW